VSFKIGPIGPNGIHKLVGPILPIPAYYLL